MTTIQTTQNHPGAQAHSEGVVFENVYKRYPNGFVAVEDLNLEIHNGEFLVMVGPSGCGKSTTLRMIAGLEDIHQGTITVGGRVVNDLPPRPRYCHGLSELCALPAYDGL